MSLSTIAILIVCLLNIYVLFWPLKPKQKSNYLLPIEDYKPFTDYLYRNGYVFRDNNIEALKRHLQNYCEQKSTEEI